jgi:hypothetical protein
MLCDVTAHEPAAEWQFAIVLMMDAVSTFNVYQTTWRNISEGSHIHTRRHKNLKSHNFRTILTYCVEYSKKVIQNGYKIYT